MESAEPIRFLTMDDLDRVHARSIRQYSPGESTAVWNEGLLRSALVTPAQTWAGEYLYSTLADMAAAYLIGLCQNHPYESANKRVAFGACALFLRLNGYRLTLSTSEATELTLGIASHSLAREDAVDILNRSLEWVGLEALPPEGESQPDP